MLKDTNRLANAEPLMRRTLISFLKFTRTTGHQHPHLQDALQNYAGLCLAMQVPQRELHPRLLGCCREAGLDEEKTREILHMAFPRQ